MMSLLLAFTVYVLNKMLATKTNSYELAKTKKEQAKRKKKRLRKKEKTKSRTTLDQLVVNSMSLEPQKPKIRRKRRKKPNDQPRATRIENVH